MTCIGSLIKDYESNITSEKVIEDKPDNRLLKTKDVILEYPILTLYSLSKAVNDNKISYTKVGNTNYFRVQDIETFINSGKKDKGV